jgi:pyruvate formate lyase activating enzyme
MSESAQPVSLQAKDPFELRVDRGQHVSEAEVRAALSSGDLGFVHSFTTGSTVDGPGVRVVAWLTGCQFRCLYCHNPDTWRMTNGVPITVERAKTEVAKYRHGLRMMKGGFTVSGGEPLMQDRFVIKLFTAAQAMGVHTALDSNGYLGSRLTDEDLEKIDLVLLDIKAWDRERHHQLTGMDIAPVLDFARRLAILRKPIWLRYVLVAGLTDDAEDIAQIANFVAGPGNVERVDVLPFHQLGAFKWKQLGIEYKLLDAEPPQRAIVERACTQFQAVGLKAY